GKDLSGRTEIDATGKLVLPGVIDGHTHLDTPIADSRTCDNFFTGTRAAARGGVTTVIDFTIGSPESSLLEDLAARKEAAAGAVIDYTFHAEVIGRWSSREDEFAAMVKAGIGSFKFYTAYGSLGHRAGNGFLYHAFQRLAELNAVAMVHAEDDEIIESLLARLKPEDEDSMLSLPRTRPAICEGSAINQVVYLAEETGVHLHIAHITSALGIEGLKRARRRGLRVSGETCPQYLLLNREVFAGDDARFYSLMPPLRTSADQEALWNALGDGTLSLVATDHCAFTREQKRWKGSFRNLPYGLPGVETLLPLLYSEGVIGGRIPLKALPHLLAEGPARIFGLYPRKGTLKIGGDADIVVFDPDQKWEISARILEMPTDFSPYEGLPVKGKVTTTISRGDIIYSESKFQRDKGVGKFLEAGF
ncbi:MAG: dihydropyrimidinase, partial [Candidatus Auribacterota bacterium]|nr:dihydropyrimidinase [Candidatus Auribacterota bacterium]